MSSTIRSIGVVVESGFGSLVTSTGLPNKTLSYTSIPCERDPIVLYGDELPMSERNEARDGSFQFPPEPDTVYSSGNRQQRRTGTVSIRLDLTTVGAAATNYDSNYLGYLLGAGLLTSKHSHNAADSVTAVSANEFTPTVASTSYAVGNLISSEVNGIAEYSAVTANDKSGKVGCSPAFSGTTYTSINPLQTWYPGSRTATGTTTHSLSFRVDGVNFRTYAWGCVMESCNISVDGGRLMADITYRAAVIQDDHSAATGPVEPVYNSGSPALFRGAYVVVSGTSPTSTTNVYGSTGDELTRIALDCEDMTFNITNTLTPKATSQDIRGMNGFEVSESLVEATITLTTVNTAIANDFFNQTLRNLVIGTGPVGDGKGCALMIPAAFQADNKASQYDVGGNDLVRQSLTFRSTRYGGDVSESGAGNSPFRLALGV